jgi:hypothetical protein
MLLDIDNDLFYGLANKISISNTLYPDLHKSDKYIGFSNFALFIIRDLEICLFFATA